MVGLTNTYVNDEFITTQAYVNEITGLNTLDSTIATPYNGIFTSHNNNSLLTTSLAFYSTSGYYPSIFSWPDTTYNAPFFKEVFMKNGILQNAGISESEIKAFVGIDESTSLDSVLENNTLLESAITKYRNVYGSDIYSVALTGLQLKSVEQNFALAISDSITRFFQWIAIVSIIISIVIFVLISSFMISENQRAIALFSILGYNTKEKIKLFFRIFIPFVVFSFMVAIGISVGLFAFLGNTLANKVSVSLPSGIEWWHVILVGIIIGIIFIVATGLSFLRIVKIKAIEALN